MQSDTHARSTATDRDTTGAISRRRLLKTTAVAAVGVAGVYATSGSGAADTDEIMELDFRYGTPPITDAPQGEDEVVFNIHGYTGSSASVSEAETLQDSMRALGNTETVTAVTWDDDGLPSTAESSARDTGPMLADWLDDYLCENPDTNVRLLGHSMGGIVTMECIAAIDGSFVIENADFIGSYEVSDAPCEGEGYFDAIANSCLHMGNYYNTSDDIARLGDGPADCSGWFSSGTTPDNYYDHDVSEYVSGHTDYKESLGCVSEIISNHTGEVSRDGCDTSDDGDDDSGWW